MTLVQRRKTIIRENAPHLQIAGEPEFHGKTLREWDAEWLPVQGGFTVLHSDLRHHVGLFQASLGRNTMYIGKAVEFKNGALRKRLSDFRRESPSGREHYGAMRIYDHLDELELHVLITGSDKAAAELAELLKPAMIVRHLPPWNMEKKQAEVANQKNLGVLWQTVASANGSAPPAQQRPKLKLVPKQR